MAIRPSNCQWRMRPALSPPPHTARSKSSGSDDSSGSQAVAVCKLFPQAYADQRFHRQIKTWLISPAPTTKDQSIITAVTTTVPPHFQTHCCHHQKLRFHQATASTTKLHQKQHYVPYYLSIVFFLSLKYAFGIISMFFTLVRCSIILSMLFLTCLHSCFLPNVQIYWISVNLLMSHKKCPIWQVLFILNLGLLHSCCIVLYSLQVHNGLLMDYIPGWSYLPSKILVAKKNS